MCIKVRPERSQSRVVKLTEVSQDLARVLRCGPFFSSSLFDPKHPWNAPYCPSCTFLVPLQVIAPHVSKCVCWACYMKSFTAQALWEH